MCGIIGFSNQTKDISSYRNVLIEMTNSISKRGPDEFGYFIDNHIAFGHRRLVVIDPEGGKQPMSETFNENTYTIIYNGQIYNTKELREELLEAGFTFNGHCDTEILLKAFILYGPALLPRLNGIFAFAIWDSKNEELFIARDHFGVKPLYYTLVDNTFIFASETKAILKHPLVEIKVDNKRHMRTFWPRPCSFSRKYCV